MLFHMRPNGWPEFEDSSTMTTDATIRTFMDMGLHANIGCSFRRGDKCQILEIEED